MQRREYAVLQKQKVVTLFNGKLETIYLGLCKKGLAKVSPNNKREFHLVYEEDLSDRSRDFLERYKVFFPETAGSAGHRPPAIYSNTSREELIHRVLSGR